ncbi:unnamed protein product [Acanthoscelides obtectus]|uniref:Uncharacterized protein n=1 Tax=Acanthoscelides obtectus TaxID=200917 RepID=A0A9P0K9V6_ACAOB|nr:unnamed protein product [Acanthoscelides obtectus]CAK1622613.1 hypothetical protein AOBTE_LOCUS1593 [Acanthoscelides obtectus]
MNPIYLVNLGLGTCDEDPGKLIGKNVLSLL